MKTGPFMPKRGRKPAPPKHIRPINPTNHRGGKPFMRATGRRGMPR